VFCAVADDEAPFDCVTLPSSPSLPIRTETFLLLGATWVAEDWAFAPCSVRASWVVDWTPEPPPVCELVCPVVPEFDAPAVEETPFDWVTSPLSPGLRIRTETFVLLG
jgi:hypothetical protein